MQLVEEKRKREEAEAAIAAKQQEFDADLVPEHELNLSDEQIQLDAFIDNIDVVEGYVKFGGQTRNPRVRPGQRENIKVRCPNPSHKDVHESFWMNRDKNAGNCGACGGFDVKDFAAFYFDFPVPDYKTNGDFPKLMEAIAESYGYHIERTLAGQDLLWKEQGSEPDEPSQAVSTDKSDNSDKAAETGNLSVGSSSEDPDNSDRTDSDVKSTSIKAVDDSNIEDLFGDDGFEIVLPSLDWQMVTPGTDTFLDRYMKACCQDEAPDEYHFFNGLIALGFAAGREVTLHSKLPVYGNLFVCALGKSGAGKSTASKHLRRVLRQVMPYRRDDPSSRGVASSTPSSAEVLVDTFSKPVFDPINPKQIAYYAPVKGLIDFNELSGLIGRAARQGNVLKPIMMDFYDMNDEVKVESRGSGSVIAADPFASCITTAQPAALSDLLRDSDDASGFLNRWVFICGAMKERTILGSGHIDLTAPIESLERIKGWAASFGPDDRINWDADALEEMQQFFNEFVYPMVQKTGTNMFVRLDLLYLKLALLLSVNKMERSVTMETVLQTKKMFKYLIECYGVPAEQVNNSLENEITEAIAYQMKRLGGKDGVSLNLIAKALKRRKYPKEMILRNIKALIELGFVEERTSGGKSAGRPTKKYVYVA